MTDLTIVRSSSSAMTRSAASARSSMLMAQIIASRQPQIFTFATHVLHRWHRFFSVVGFRSIAPPTNDEEDDSDDTTNVSKDHDAGLDRGDHRGGGAGRTSVGARTRRDAWRHDARGHHETRGLRRARRGA